MARQTLGTTVSDKLSINKEVVPKGKVFHRVHPDKYVADAFNPSDNGNARFSPIKDANGEIIPTIYLGTTNECALMETAFHDVPHTKGTKVIFKDRLESLQHSQVTLNEDLVVVDLSARGLRKMGFKKTEIIETEADKYPVTRAIAEQIHAENSEVQGLQWVSRQDDTAKALVLFGDRVAKNVIQKVGKSKSLTNDQDTYAKVLDLAEEIGVSIINLK